MGRNPAKAIKMAQMRRQVDCQGAIDIGVSIPPPDQLQDELEELLSPPNTTTLDNSCVEGKDSSSIMEYMELSDE